MNIGFLGARQTMTSALGRHLVGKGHKLCCRIRVICAKLDKVARELGGGTRTARPRGRAFGDVVVLATG